MTKPQQIRWAIAHAVRPFLYRLTIELDLWGSFPYLRQSNDLATPSASHLIEAADSEKSNAAHQDTQL